MEDVAALSGPISNNAPTEVSKEVSTQDFVFPLMESIESIFYSLAPSKNTSLPLLLKSNDRQLQMACEHRPLNYGLSKERDFHLQKKDLSHINHIYDAIPR